MGAGEGSGHGHGEGAGEGKGEMQQQQQQQQVIGMQPVGYGAQPVGYPVGYGGQQQQQQQATTVVVTQQGVGESQPSMTGAIIFSCFVFWCCNCLFGCIGFFIAIGGLSAESPSKGKQLRSASFGVSIAGLVLSLVIGLVFLIVYFVAFDTWQTWFNSNYDNYGYGY